MKYSQNLLLKTRSQRPQRSKNSEGMTISTEVVIVVIVEDAVVEDEAEEEVITISNENICLIYIHNSLLNLANIIIKVQRKQTYIFYSK